MSGDSAGEPMVLTGKSSVNRLGYDYDDVGLREIRQMPEERFCSAMGISPISLNFGTSKESATYSNVEQYLRHDYRSYIVRVHKHIALQLQWDLLPEYGETDDKKVAWDYSQVPEMQPDFKMQAEWMTPAWEKGWLKRSEIREAFGYEWDEEDNIYIDAMGTTEEERQMARDEERAGDLMDDETMDEGQPVA
jgi:hypothetical protein